MSVTIASANALTLADFTAVYGDIAEHSPWVAEQAGKTRPFASREAMIAAFETAMRAAPDADQLALVQAHPDLAGRAALAGQIAADSRKEQAGAGLDTLTAEEFARFTHLNDSYKARFGFPFILAVKGATKHQILAAFEARLAHGVEEEFETALTQIARIFRFRLEDRISP